MRIYKIVFDINWVWWLSLSHELRISVAKISNCWCDNVCGCCFMFLSLFIYFHHFRESAQIKKILCMSLFVNDSFSIVLCVLRCVYTYKCVCAIATVQVLNIPILKSVWKIRFKSMTFAAKRFDIETQILVLSAFFNVQHHR